MENDVIANDFIEKFMTWETSKKYSKYKNDYTKSTQSKHKHTNWQKAKSDGMSMNEILIRNLYMWSDYAYDGMSYQEIANKFDLSYGWTIGIVDGMDKKIKLFFKKHIGEV